MGPRSCCRWLELMIATPVLGDPLEPWVTLPRLPMLPSQRPTPTSHKTCGRRQCSRSHPSRSSLTSCPRTTDPWECRGSLFLSFFVLFCPFLSFFVLFCPFLSFLSFFV